jgi:hypothetical protein
MDAVVALRMFERILSVLMGGLSIYFGYRLFLKIPVTTTASGTVTLPWNVTVVLSRAGPGIFFALFGVSLIAFSFYQHVHYDEKRAGHEAQVKEAPRAADQKSFNGAAPVIVDAVADGREDARMMLRRDIAILNTLPAQLNPSLSAQDRNLGISAIRRIKFELMKPVWGSDWGDQHKFEDWIRKGASSPPEPELRTARAYFLYPAKDDQP